MTRSRRALSRLAQGTGLAQLRRLWRRVDVLVGDLREHAELQGRLVEEVARLEGRVAEVAARRSSR